MKIVRNDCSEPRFHEFNFFPDKKQFCEEINSSFRVSKIIVEYRILPKFLIEFRVLDSSENGQFFIRDGVVIESMLVLTEEVPLMRQPIDYRSLIEWQPRGQDLELNYTILSLHPDVHSSQEVRRHFRQKQENLRKAKSEIQLELKRNGIGLFETDYGFQPSREDAERLGKIDFVNSLFSSSSALIQKFGTNENSVIRWKEEDKILSDLLDRGIKADR